MRNLQEVITWNVFVQAPEPPTDTDLLLAYCNDSGEIIEIIEARYNSDVFVYHGFVYHGLVMENPTLWTLFPKGPRK